MKSPAPYRTSQKFWRAVAEPAKTATNNDDRSVTACLGQFVHDRCPARILNTTGHGALKGVNAVLARVSDARTMQEADPLRRLGDVDLAYSDLHAAAKVDLADYSRIEQGRNTVAGQGGDQPAAKGVRVAFDGGQLQACTGMRGLGISINTLCPVLEPLADKVCATQDRYGCANHRSGRVQHLVDVVVFPGTQNIDGAAPTSAIGSEWAARKLAGAPSCDPRPD